MEAAAEGSVETWRRVRVEPRFLIVALELALVLALVHVFGIEAGRGLPELVPLVFVGFLVHATLPMAWRRPFFLVLSLAGFAVVFAPLQLAALVGIGLVLLGVCHLPVAFWLRVALLLGCGAVLTSMRAGWVDVPWAAPILPVIGAMFMFRLVLYVYDLRTEAPGGSPWERLSYFFLLPNAVFPLFPIIDVKVWRRCWYQRDEHEVHRKGVRWMARGVAHLLLYRVVYMHFTPELPAVHDLYGVVLTMVSSYALYLRVSGLFHLIVGMTALFGYDLPETHHHYFLASGFNDLWRRINIYWKDFMMKIVYYPIFVRLRRRSAGQALVVATVAVFGVSWMLHSYQMFWVRGGFPITRVDAVFWCLFAVAVLGNSWLQTRFPPRRRLGARTVGWREAVATSLKTTAMFAFMCAFWAFWTGHSGRGFLDLLWRAAGSPASQFVGLLLGLASLVALGVLYQLQIGPRWRRLAARVPPRGQTAAHCAVLLGLGALGLPDVTGLDAGPLVASIRRERLNARDEAKLLLGYYEELLEEDRTLGDLWGRDDGGPEDWPPLRATPIIHWLEGTVQERELKPNVDYEHKGARVRTNRHRLRDRDYEGAKPAGTYRFALLGASIEMGEGVENEQVFEALAEEQLNALATDGRVERFEVLNFAVSGMSPLAQVPMLQHRARLFEPDALLLFSHTIDARLLQPHLDRLASNGVEIPYRGLRRIIETYGSAVTGGGAEADEELLEAGGGVDWGDGRLADATLPPGAFEGDDAPAPEVIDLWTYQRIVLFWVYQRLVKDCERFGIRPVWVYLQHPPLQTEGMVSHGRSLMGLARGAGFHVIELDGSRIYPEERVDELMLGPWDNHPNAEGHRLIADELVRQLRAHEAALGLHLADATPGGAAGTPALDQEPGPENAR